MHAIITKKDLEQAIKKLSSKLCAGMDGLPSKAIKMVAPFIVDQLLDFFNKVCTNGIPTMWRVAIVRSLHKNGSKKDCSNFRLISNLCSLAKLYKRCILGKLDDIEADMQGKTNMVLESAEALQQRRCQFNLSLLMGWTEASM